MCKCKDKIKFFGDLQQKVSNLNTGDVFKIPVHRIKRIVALRNRAYRSNGQPEKCHTLVKKDKRTIYLL